MTTKHTKDTKNTLREQVIHVLRDTSLSTVVRTSENRKGLRKDTWGIH